MNAKRVTLALGALLLRFGRWADDLPSRLYQATVFRRLSKGASMGDRIANLFHRVSAVLYFIYFLWGCFAVPNGLPSLIQANGAQWQVIFSIAITVVSLPASVGAAFWPAFARLELWMSSSFVGLCAIYVVTLFFFATTLASPILLASVLVVPVARVYIIVWFLLEQAEAAKKAAMTLAATDGE